MNRLLKFPRPKKAAGRGYILGRVNRETIESDSIDEQHSEDDDGIYVDRRHRFDLDNQSAGSTTSDADHERNIDSNDHVSIDFEADAIYRNVIASASRPTTSSTSGDSSSKKSYARKKTSSAAPTATSPKKTIRTNINLNINSSSTITNVPKMTTRYRFRDLLLGDFSFNDDGER